MHRAHKTTAKGVARHLRRSGVKVRITQASGYEKKFEIWTRHKQC